MLLDYNTFTNVHELNFITGINKLILHLNNIVIDK